MSDGANDTPRTADFETITYAIADSIAVITLDRPERLNAFTETMGAELVAAMDAVDDDDQVRAAVFTGSGRAFCAGADISAGTEVFERGSGTPFRMDRHADWGGVVARRFLASTKPLIAAINGPAVGIGLTATLPMDARLASDTARFGFVFTRRGLVPEACSSWFLPRIVGIDQALDWVYSGRLFDADEALRAGLVRSVHPGDELLDAALALAREWTQASAAVSVAISRWMLWRLLADATPAIAHEIDSLGIFSLGRSADADEGVAAFLEKRPADFPMQVSTDLPEFFVEWRRTGDLRMFGQGP
jgi:enoyl-CoA hydratase/carnithine racemase